MVVVFCLLISMLNGGQRSSPGNEACSNLNWECWCTHQANNLEVCAMLLCSMKLRWDEKLVCWSPLCDMVHAI
jgi:hypothetical protein